MAWILETKWTHVRLKMSNKGTFSGPQWRPEARLGTMKETGMKSRNEAYSERYLVSGVAVPHNQLSILGGADQKPAGQTRHTRHRCAPCSTTLSGQIFPATILAIVPQSYLLKKMQIIADLLLFITNYKPGEDNRLGFPGFSQVPLLLLAPFRATN